METIACGLLNICYGGMSFTTERLLQQHKDYEFLVDLQFPFNRWVLVKAHVCWVSVGGNAQVTAGAEFIESSSGWFGREEAVENYAARAAVEGCPRTVSTYVM